MVILFPDLGCYVTLPASEQFRARTEASPWRQRFETALLEGAEICSEGSVLLKDGESLTSDELRAHVGARVASFKVPAIVLFRDEPLPRNASGEMLKRELQRDFTRS